MVVVLVVAEASEFAEFGFLNSEEAYIGETTSDEETPDVDDSSMERGAATVGEAVSVAEAAVPKSMFRNR